jgi:hypothetical protein
MAKMFLIDHSHHSKVFFTLWLRLVVYPAAMKTQQSALLSNAQMLVIEFDP